MCPYWLTADESRESGTQNEPERKREHEIVRRVIYTLFHTMALKGKQIGPAVGLGHVPANMSGVLRPSKDHGEQMGSNLTLGLLLKWLPPCPADEELTSSGTMAEWEEGRGRHRPGDRHTMVFDRGVVTLSGENLRPGPGSGDRVGPGLQESPCGRVGLGCITRVGHLFPSPFVQWKPGLINISQSYFLALST